MGARWCYPLLSPMRALTCSLCLCNFIAICIGKRFSIGSDTITIVNNPPVEAKNYFQDSDQIGINFVMFIMSLWVFYRPQSSYWWTAGRIQRMLSAGIMAGLGAGYGISLLVKILTSGDPIFALDGTAGYSTMGCRAQIYDLTRGHCFVQMGVSTSEMTWAFLVILECGLWIVQRKDKEWHAQKARTEVQRAVIYQPTITLPTADPDVVDTMELQEVRVISSEGQQTEQVGDQVIATSQEDDSLPNYSHRAPRGQPKIIDATHPPERLREEIDRLQSSSGSSSEPAPSPHSSTVAPSSTMPPAYSE